jgi:hypothetical protein
MGWFDFGEKKPPLNLQKFEDKQEGLSYDTSGRNRHEFFNVKKKTPQGEVSIHWTSYLAWRWEVTVDREPIYRGSYRLAPEDIKKIIDNLIDQAVQSNKANIEKQRAEKNQDYIDGLNIAKQVLNLKDDPPPTPKKVKLPLDITSRRSLREHGLEYDGAYIRVKDPEPRIRRAQEEFQKLLKDLVSNKKELNENKDN